MIKITYSNIAEFLLDRIPEFQDDFGQYLKNQGGEMLPHVLFGDFTRFFVRKFYESQKNPGAKDILLRCGAFIEDLLETNQLDLKGLVVVSFLENLFDPKEDYYQPIKQYLKQKTLELLKEFEK